MAKPALRLPRTGAGDRGKASAREAAALEGRKAAGPTLRTKATFDIPTDVLRELRVAVSELPPKHVRGGMSGVVSRAIEAELERLRKAHNAGQPFESDEEPSVPRGPAKRS